MAEWTRVVTRAQLARKRFREILSSMIRRLVERDRTATVALLEQQPEFNLYSLGNLESLGFEHDVCEFWGAFSPDGSRLCAVANRYRTGWTVFGEAGANWSDLGKLVDTHPIQATRLQDNPGGVPSFLPYLHRYRSAQVSSETFMRLVPQDFRPEQATDEVAVRQATLADLPALIELYRDAGHMSRSPATVEQPLRKTRVWLAEIDGQVAGAALTNAETLSLAMVGGVYTAPAYRNRRIATAICSALCCSLLAARKQPVLYWDSPAAGAVYRRLGFRLIGTWRSVWLAPGHQTA